MRMPLAGDCRASAVRLFGWQRVMRLHGLLLAVRSLVRVRWLVRGRFRSRCCRRSGRGGMVAMLRGRGMRLGVMTGWGVGGGSGECRSGEHRERGQREGGADVAQGARVEHGQQGLRRFECWRVPRAGGARRVATGRSGRIARLSCHRQCVRAAAIVGPPYCVVEMAGRPSACRSEARLANLVRCHMIYIWARYFP